MARTGDVGRLIYPLVRELPADLETPLSVYLKLRGLGPSFLLESIEGGEHLARDSMIGTQPRAVLRAWADRVVLEEEGRWQELPVTEGDPLDLLQHLMPRYAPGAAEGLPRFSGGAVGYLSYDAVRWFERVPDCAPDTLGLPEAAFLLCDQVVLYDHVASRLMVVAHAESESPHHPSRRAAEAAIAQVVARLDRPLPREDGASGGTGASGDDPLAGYESAFGQAAFEEAVVTAKEQIAAGDIFQVVPSRRVHRRTSASALAIYRALRRINPSPYMFYLELPDGLRLIGSSPEVLVRLEGDLVETRPLAGTRPRGATPAEDAALARELLADPKERAEHVMLVDLARNDLGRVCAYGTVHTPVLMEIERYSHVMHIVSSVQGTLAEGCDATDVLRACFPAGTVSGAPKVRAMEIIDALEPERRGPYAGAVGYLSYSGNMDTCITIRTLVMRGDRVYLQAGAGIVADSDPRREFNEVTSKLRAAAQAVAAAEAAQEGSGRAG